MAPRNFTYLVILLAKIIPRTLAIIALISSIILLSIFAISFVSRVQLVRAAVHTQGKVLQVDKLSPQSSPTAVFTFTDASGNVHQVDTTGSSGSFNFNVGDTVPVIYHPVRPEEAKIYGTFSVWAVPLVTGIFGVFDLLVGLGIWFGTNLLQKSLRHRFSLEPSGADAR
ncbi:DUF3592 domain-containing protein [Verrucomicrobiota bacterium sgz303538]